MDAFGIADIYRAARLPVTAESIALRQKPFEALRSKLTLRQAVDLARLYFGLKKRPVGSWFVDAFHGEDNSFSMHDNAREAAVLAGALLAAAVQKDKEENGLAPLVASFAGARKPLVVPELLALFERRLAESAIDSRKANTFPLVKGPAAFKVGPLAANLPQTPDWAAAGNLIKQAADESQAAITALAGATSTAMGAMKLEIDNLREETDMLWWHIGGVSRRSNEAFAGMTPGAAAVMAGIDMSDLAKDLAGPYAAPALLQRTLQTGRKGKLPALTLQEAIDEIPAAVLASITSDAKVAELADICPVMFAVSKCHESGSNATWVAAFEKASGISAKTKMSPAELALQAYRENQLLAGLD